MKSVLLSALFALGIAQAQVPADIEAGLVKMGHIVDPPCTAKLYRPLMPMNDINSSAKPLYPGITITREVSFGPNPKDFVDIFTADKGSKSRPVLIYIAGGAGNRIEQQDREANAFYDNIMRWATKNGMVGVNMQRRPGSAWDDPAKDISLVVQWVQNNATKHKGNARRVFIWSQSAGNVPTATYVGHPELYGPKGIGLKGVIFMSPPAFDILPATVPPGGGGGGFGACGQPNGGPPAAVAPGGRGGGGRGPSAGPGAGRGGDGKGTGAGGGRGKQAPPDPATQLARSNLPGLVKSKIPYMLAVAELDPPNILSFSAVLKDELCKAGRCPTYLELKDHSHVSEVFSPNTADDSVTGPILKWMTGVK